MHTRKYDIVTTDASEIMYLLFRLIRKHQNSLHTTRQQEPNNGRNCPMKNSFLNKDHNNDC